MSGALVLRALPIVFVALSAMESRSARAQSFNDAPISCGTMVQFKGCTAAFDGQKLLVTYINPDGKKFVAVYKHCVADLIGIRCPEGRWQADDMAGKLGARSIGLRNGLPFPD
jgi:hypothetical protein